jgi:hypothetical protein
VHVAEESRAASCLIVHDKHLFLEPKPYLTESNQFMADHPSVDSVAVVKSPTKETSSLAAAVCNRARTMQLYNMKYSIGHVDDPTQFIVDAIIV